MKNNLFLVTIFITIFILFFIFNFSFFSEKSVVSHKDISFPLDYRDLLYTLIFMYNGWNKVQNSYFTQIIYYFFPLIISKINLHLGIKMLFIIFPFTSFLTFYFSNIFLIKKLKKEIKFNEKIFLMILSFYYSFNPYSLLIYHNDIGYSIIHSIFPLFTFFLFYEKKLIKTILFSFWLLLIFSQPQGIFLSFPLILIIFIDYIKKLNFFYLLILLFLIEFYILPVFFIYFKAKPTPSGYIISENMITFESSKTNIIKSIYMENWPWEDDKILSKGQLLNSFWSYTFLLPIIIFLLNFVVNKNNILLKYEIFFLSISLLYLLLSSGINSPVFGNFYKWFVYNLNFGWVLRSPYRFNTFFIYSLCSFGVIEFLKVNQLKIKSLAILFIIIIFISILPLIYNFINGSWILPLKNIPIEYEYLNEYLKYKNHKNGVILILPSLDPYKLKYRNAINYAIPKSYTLFCHNSKRERTSIIVMENFILEKKCDEIKRFFDNSIFSFIVIDNNIDDKNFREYTFKINEKLSTCFESINIKNITIFDLKKEDKTIFAPQKISIEYLNLRPIEENESLIYLEKNNIDFLNILSKNKSNINISFIKIKKDDINILFTSWWNFPENFLWDFNEGLMNLKELCNINFEEKNSKLIFNLENSSLKKIKPEFNVTINGNNEYTIIENFVDDWSLVYTPPLYLENSKMYFIQTKYKLSENTIGHLNFYLYDENYSEWKLVSQYDLGNYGKNSIPIIPRNDTKFTKFGIIINIRSKNVTEKSDILIEYFKVFEIDKKNITNYISLGDCKGVENFEIQKNKNIWLGYYLSPGGGVFVLFNKKDKYISDIISTSSYNYELKWLRLNENIQIKPIYGKIVFTSFEIQTEDPNILSSKTTLFLKKPNILKYEKINPTLYKVQVNATEPFMLSFAESYDPLWEARVYKNGKLVEKSKPVPLYGVINGFWINTTGENLEIVIRYKPQDYFEFGLVISGTTLTACIGYLIYDWKRDFFDEKIGMVLKSKKYR